MPTVAPLTVVLSGPKRADLQVYRGDSGMFRLTVVDTNDDPYDISAGVFDADVRLKTEDANPVFSMDVVPVVGQTNKVDVILSSANSELLNEKRYAYDVEMRLAGQVVTLVTGVISVTKDTSRP